MLTDAQKDQARKAFAAHLLSGEPCTFGELTAIGDRALQLAPRRHNDPSCYRLADQWLQQQRRAGCVAFVRVGRQSLWSPTEAGRRALAEQAGGENA